MNPWIGLAFAVLLLDQASKLAAEYWLVYHQSVALLPVLNLTLSYNPGAAFSYLGEAGGWQRWFFSAIALGVSLYILWWLHQIRGRRHFLACGLALVLGGAVGNLIDRVVHGYVIDFIHVYWRDWHYPIFNVADIGITVGVVMVMVYMIFLEPKQA
ncbi:signal peptidase II [Alkalilimnicola ehrlichii]|uniref:signal peptidase II n=1 Tax=Alkalilimnicola ehrlichii TaxID=351052 RepID=UPI003BA311BC